MTGKRRALAIWPMAGRCTVCGHAAQALVVYRSHREVRHVSGSGAACALPNPPAEPKAVAS